MINLLLDNSYPFEFVFSLIKKRLHSKFHSNIHKQVNDSEDNDKNYFIIPYMGNMSDKTVQYLINTPNFNVVFFGLNKLNSIIKVHKDILLIYAQSNCGIQNLLPTLRCNICGTNSQVTKN